MSRIVSYKVFSLKARLKKPFRIALGESYEAESVFVVVESQSGAVGVGEASPAPMITGDNLEGTKSFLLSVNSVVTGCEIPRDLNKLLKFIHRYPGFPAARAALEIALLDLWAREEGLRFVDLLGGPVKSEVRTDLTIGIEEPKVVAEEARRIVEAGFREIKVKLGEDPARDVERIKALRDAVGYDVRVRVDANQGWTPKQAVRIARELERLEVELIEQPVPYWCLDGLKLVTESTEIPVAADESAKTLRDVLRIIEMKAADVVNIKLMKCGGPLQAMYIARVCEEAGLQCMIGCMLETKAAITAAACVAYASPTVKYVDLDSPLMIAEDPVKGGIVYEDGGLIRLPSEPGLGVEVR